jgi:hypothetical protein
MCMSARNILLVLLVLLDYVSLQWFFKFHLNLFLYIKKWQVLLLDTLNITLAPTGLTANKILLSETLFMYA